MDFQNPSQQVNFYQPFTFDVEEWKVDVGQMSGPPVLLAPPQQQAHPCSLSSSSMRQNLVDIRTISTELLNVNGVLVRRSVEQYTVDVFEGKGGAVNRKILRFVNTSAADEDMITQSSNIKNMDIFTCTECSKPFKTSTQLQRHSKVHEGGTFRCEICSAFFRYKIAFTKHRMESHQ